jgi:hypothetical protein
MMYPKEKLKQMLLNLTIFFMRLVFFRYSVCNSLYYYVDCQAIYVRFIQLIFNCLFNLFK